MPKKSRLLLPERPLVVLPELATKIGLNQAIFVQQVHYWISEHGHKRDGRKWVYNTLDGWGEQFPFWSSSTLRRTIANSRKIGVILVGEYNKMRIDRTLWYSIDYDKLSKIERGICSNRTDASVQNEQKDVFNLSRPITRDYTETRPQTTFTPEGCKLDW